MAPVMKKMFFVIVVEGLLFFLDVIKVYRT